MSNNGGRSDIESEIRGSFSNAMHTSNSLVIINSAFATERPKHFIRGLTDAVQNILAGVGVGLGTLVAAPVIMFKKGLCEGFKGIGLGVAGLIGFTVYGVGTAICQVARGAINTPKAVKESLEGKQLWDSFEKRWVTVNLTDSFANLPVTDNDIIAEARESFRRNSENNENQESDVHGTVATDNNPNSLYSILDVPKTATPAEIRSAFRTKAVQMHPDKNPDDPSATIRFQKLQEAYAVLSNEDRRHRYDTEGTVDGTHMPNDSSTLFGDAFGAQFLLPFIGRISCALYFTPNAYFDEELRKRFQHNRILRIAQFLARYTDGDTTLEEIRPLINDAISSRLGPMIMSVVADQYNEAARQHLYNNGFIRDMDSFFSTKVSSVSHIANTCGAGIKGLVKKYTEDNVMKMMFSIAEPDIRRTVLNACHYLFYDTSASPDKRQQRALRLKDLSHYMHEEIKKVQEAREHLPLN